MGLLDSLKSMLGIKGSLPPNPAKIIEKAKGRVTGKAMSQLKGQPENVAKNKLADIAADEVNGVVDEMDDPPKGVVRDRLVERAVESVIEKVWDEIKDKIAGSGDGDGDSGGGDGDAGDGD